MNEDLEKLTAADIRKAINSYADWINDIGDAEKARSIFLPWRGELLDAKAIVKYALKKKKLNTGLHSHQAKNRLKALGFPIRHEKSGGKDDQAATTARKELVERPARDGQSAFRFEAMEIWNDRCAVSRCDVDAALEAAHIIPFADEGEMDAKNSIVLRADLHRLFDMDLMAINPKTMRVNFKKKAGSYYRDLKGRKVKLPKGGPSEKDFKERWKQFRAV